MSGATGQEWRAVNDILRSPYKELRAFANRGAAALRLHAHPVPARAGKADWAQQTVAEFQHVHNQNG
jgi:hypothetical protein